MDSGTSPSAAEEALRPATETENFHRLAWLLMRGGLTLFREVFNTIHPPDKLSDVLRKNKSTLKGVLFKSEWFRLYDPLGPETYGESTDFDISLLYKLFREICNLTSPKTGWVELPDSSDDSREADIVRIRCYRNDIFAHNHRMEVTDADFKKLWVEISEALLRIASSISSAKRDEWKKAIKKFFHEPLTQEAKECAAKLRSWYLEDMETKARVQELTEEVKEMKKVLMDISIYVKDLKPRESITPQVPSVIPEQPQIEGSAEVSTSSDLQSQQEHPKALGFWSIVKGSFDLLFKYFKMKLGAEVQGYRLGSLVLNVSCSSLEVLEALWEDYRTGHLNEVIQDMLATAEVLEKLNLEEVKLITIISEEDYLSCKDVLKKNSGNSFFVSVQVIPWNFF